MIRTRDRPVFLARSLNTVREQTYTDWVAVVIDQGNPEVTQKVLETFEPEFRAKVRHLPVPETVRLGGMLNAGLAVSESDYVVRLDDDDTWLPTFLEKMEHALRNKPSEAFGAVACQSVVVNERMDENGQWVIYEERLKPPFQCVNLRDLLKGPAFQVHAFLYERRCHERVGLFDEEVSAMDDWNFHARFVCHHEIAVVDEVLVRYHKRPEVTGRGSGSTPNPAGNSAGILVRGRYDMSSWANTLVRDYLGVDETRLGLLHVLGQMERNLETRVATLSLEVAAMDRRLQATSDKVGKIDARTRKLKGNPPRPKKP